MPHKELKYLIIRIELFSQLKHLDLSSCFRTKLRWMMRLDKFSLRVPGLGRRQLMTTVISTLSLANFICYPFV